MSESERREMRALDEAAERAGGFVAPFMEPGIHYDYRKLLTYCREKGIEPLDLTLRELHKFILES